MRYAPLQKIIIGYNNNMCGNIVDGISLGMIKSISETFEWRVTSWNTCLFVFIEQMQGKKWK